MANSSSNLDLISASQANKEITANSLFDAGSPALLYGRRASTSAALTWGYYGGTVMVAGTPTQIANGTVTLATSATNYIEANPANGAVSVNQTGFTSGRTPLYSVVTGTSTVASYTDLRIMGGGGVTSVTASNGVRTATGSPVTGSDTIEGDLPINAQTGTSYTIVTGDRGKAVTFNNASPIAATIAAAGSTGFPSGWYVELVNLGNGVVTLTPTTSTVDGASSITLAIHDNICLFSDGTNYFTLRGRISGAGSGTVTSVALSTPGVLYGVSGSPVTSSGTLALSLINQAVNSVLAGPASGGTAPPSFRALAIADLNFTDTDTALAANSDAKLATQKAVKAYIDNTVTGGAAGVMVFKGAIDCSANPNYPAASAGAVYKVSVAGRLGGASGVVVEVGDTAYCTSTAASGDQATVGSSWNVVQENIDGAVVGPSSATDGHVALFNGATGKLIKDSGLTLAGTNTGDETATTTGALIHGAAAKTTPADADEMDLTDSAASFVMKKITWANVKATLKAYFDALYATFGEVVNAQTGTTYTYLNSDMGKLVTHSNAGAIAGTLPQAGSGGNFAANWWVDVQNRGAGTLTITPTTSTVDGAATLALATGQGARIISDGTNYFTQRGCGGSSGGGTPGGSTTQLQFNDGGAFAGTSTITWDKTNNILFVGTSSTPVTIQGSAAATTSSTGVALTIKGGTGGTTTGIGGAVNITGGSSASSSTGGPVSVTGGAGTTGNATGGDVVIAGGQGVGSVNGSAVRINGGPAAATAGSQGGGVVITAANGTTTGTGSKGGDVTINAGNTVGTVGATAGAISITSGSGNAGGLSTGGPVSLASGNGGANAAGGTINITAGTGGGTNGTGGAVTIAAGNSGSNKDGGTVTIQGGTGGNSIGNGGPVSILAGAPGIGNGGAVNITGSNGAGTNKNGGNVVLTPGTATGTGTPGNVVLNGSGAALATTAIGGFTCIPTCAGAPTGTPANIPAGTVPMVFDTTNKKLWMYVGSSWVGVVLS